MSGLEYGEAFEVSPQFDDQGNIRVVVLEVIEPGAPRPPYCLHGQTVCIECADWLWLGHETYEVVSTGYAVPMCPDCAGRRGLLDRPHQDRR